MRKSFCKQTEKQVDARTSLKPSFDKTNKLKQIENVFLQNIVKKMIIDRLKKFFDLQNNIKLGNLCYKNYDFDKVPLPCIFSRDIYKNNLTIGNADNEQSDLFRVFCNLNKGRKSSEKVSFLKSVTILLKVREDVVDGFKTNLFPIKSENAPY